MEEVLEALRRIQEEMGEKRREMQEIKKGIETKKESQKIKTEKAVGAGREAEGKTPSRCGSYAGEDLKQERRNSWTEEVEEGARRKEKERKNGKENSSEEEKKSTEQEETEKKKSSRGKVNDNSEGNKKIEEEEKEEKERRKEEGEKRRHRNIVVRGLDKEIGGCKEAIKEWIEEVLRKPVDLGEVKEVKGREGDMDIVLVEIMEEKDRDRILERRNRLWDTARISVDRDRTFEERKARWLSRQKTAIEKENREKSRQEEAKREKEKREAEERIREKRKEVERKLAELMKEKEELEREEKKGDRM